jgi:hypothetical protein
MGVTWVGWYSYDLSDNLARPMRYFYGVLGQPTFSTINKKSTLAVAPIG